MPKTYRSVCPAIYRDGVNVGGQPIFMAVRSNADVAREKEVKPISKQRRIINAMVAFLDRPKPTFDGLFGAADRSIAKGANHGRAMT